MDKLGLLSPFLFAESNGNFDGPHLGARVATMELLKNIVTHGGYDRCDFLLGLEGRSHDEVTRYISSQNWDPKRILVYDGPLPLDRLESNRYYALHKPSFDISDALALRHALGHPLAPATVVNHTISYSMLMPIWMEFLLGHVLPCDALVCTSTASREVIKNCLGLLTERLSTQLGATVPPFRGQLKIIPLGVDVEFWHPETNETRTKAKKDMWLPENSCLILCPARFSPHDKMDLRPFLIAIQKLLPVLGPDCFKVVLVGDEKVGGQSKLIQEFVNKIGLNQIVKIDTNGDPSNIRQYYRAADLFVSIADNIQETFGLTVIQAMACGLPAIVSDWNGYKDTVVHRETGFRIRTYWADCDKQISNLGNMRSWIDNHLFLAQSVSVDIDEMEVILHRLAIDRELRCTWGEAGRKRAEELYAWPVVVNQYRKLWDECHEKFGQIDLQEWIRGDHDCILSPQYFSRFSHYPSEIISPETKLAVRAARAGLASKTNPTEEVFLPSVMNQVFHPAVFEALRSRLPEWPLTFGTLVTDVSNETGHPCDLVARQIMWLIKYGVMKPVKTKKEYAAKRAESDVLQEQDKHPMPVQT